MTAAGIVLGVGGDALLGDPRRFHPVAGFGQAAATLERVAYRPTRRAGAAYAAVLVGSVVAAPAALERVLPRTPRAGRRAVGGARRTLARARGAGRCRSGRARRHRRGAQACPLAGRPRPAAPRRDRAVQGRDRVGRREHRRRCDRAAVLGRGRRRAGRARAPRGEHARRDGRQAQRALPATSAPRRRAPTTSRTGPPRGSPGCSVGATARRGATGAKAHPSPNAGVIEAAFAGALGVELGGTLAYAGQVEHRPRLNPGGRAADPARRHERDPPRATHLARHRRPRRRREPAMKGAILDRRDDVRRRARAS